MSKLLWSGFRSEKLPFFCDVGERCKEKEMDGFEGKGKGKARNRPRPELRLLLSLVALIGAELGIRLGVLFLLKDAGNRDKPRKGLKLFSIFAVDSLLVLLKPGREEIVGSSTLSY